MLSILFLRRDNIKASSSLFIMTLVNSYGGKMLNATGTEGKRMESTCNSTYFE